MDLTQFEKDEIVSIEPVGEQLTVDITVDDTHMFYLANGVYTHNSGLNAEVITMEAISEAFSKCFVADFICSISRTIEDKTENKGRMFVAKNRNGIDGIVYPMEIDTARVHLKVLPPDEHSTIDAVVTKTKQEQDAHLRAKYKKFKADRARASKAKAKADTRKEEKSFKKSLKQTFREIKEKQQKEGEVTEP